MKKETATAAKGVKWDLGKRRWALFPFEAAGLVVDVLGWAILPKESGGPGYPPDNWKIVPEGRRRYFEAAMRHLVAWKNGERLDRDSHLPHLAHAGCCVLFLLAIDEGTDETDPAG